MLKSTLSLLLLVFTLFSLACSTTANSATDDDAPGGGSASGGSISAEDLYGDWMFKTIIWKTPGKPDEVMRPNTWPELELHRDQTWWLELYNAHEGGTWSVKGGKLVMLNDDSKKSEYETFTITMNPDKKGMTLVSKSGGTTYEAVLKNKR